MIYVFLNNFCYRHDQVNIQKLSRQKAPNRVGEREDNVW